MASYITTADAAAKWNITTRRVQLYCSENRIPGAVKHSGIWLIPSSSIRPDKIKSGSKKEAFMPSLNVLSLFSGCGGLDLGFEGGFSVLKASINNEVNPHWKVQIMDEHWVKLPKTRFRTVFANDIRPDAKAAWSKYFSKLDISPATYYLDSIVDLVKLHKENKINVFPKNIDVVTGGFPCQDFSVAGKRKGFDSDKSHRGNSITNEPSEESRGQLYMWMREVISIVQPKVFIAENVKGLMNLADAKEIIEKDFSSACDGGYIVVPARVLHAADFGVPQSRERVIFYGFKKSALTKQALEALSNCIIPEEYDPYPVRTHSIVNEDGRLNYVTTYDCLNDLLEPECASDLSQKKYSKAKFMGKHCQGQNEINLETIAPTIRSEHHGNIEYRRLSKEHGGTHEDELNAGLKERRLTVRECARIQTFPDDYEFVFSAEKERKGVSASDAYKLIGNAVPPLLGFHIAMRLQDIWELYFGSKK